MRGRNSRNPQLQQILLRDLLLQFLQLFHVPACVHETAAKEGCFGSGEVDGCGGGEFDWDA